MSKLSSRSLLSAAFILQMSAACLSAQGQTLNSHIRLYAAWDTYQVTPPTPLYLDEQFDLSTAAVTRSIPNTGVPGQPLTFWPASAYATVSPAQDEAAGFVESHAFANDINSGIPYAAHPEESFADSATTFGTFVNTTSDQLMKFTITAETKITGGGGLFFDDYYRATVFGNSCGWLTAIDIPGAIVLDNESGFGDTKTRSWSGQTIPWWTPLEPMTQPFLLEQTRVVTFLLYPGQSVEGVMQASVSVDMRETYGAQISARVDAVTAPTVSQAVGTVVTATPAVSNSDWDQLGIPNAPCTVVYFGERPTDTHIAVTEPTTVGRVAISSPVGKYTIDGPATLTLQCGGNQVGFDVLAGQHTVNAPLQVNNNFSVLTTGANDKLTISSSSVSYAAGVSFLKSGEGKLSIPSLPTGVAKVLGGTVQITGTTPVRVSGIDVGATAKLDLTDRDMIVDYTSDSPKANVVRLLATGRQAGWNGLGISASAADDSLQSSSAHMRALGYAEASKLGLTSFAGQPVDNTTLLVKYTFNGDATFDELVNFDDLLKVSQNYGLRGKEWTDADFTYDGLVDFDDFLALSQNYGVNVPLRSGGGGSALMRGEAMEGDAILSLVAELQAGAPWILADALAHPEGAAFFGPYVSALERNSSSLNSGLPYVTHLQDYHVVNNLVPEPATVVLAALGLLPRGRRR